MRPTTSLAAAFVATLLAAAPAAAGAQARTMSWRAFDVEAHLDASGDLHVVERQEIVFTGAWNGGERIFRIGRGQRLRFERLLRETEDGGRVPLARGDLDLVDRWAFTDGRTLRWRSRAPADPPFSGTALVYVLEYTLSGVLVAEGEGRFVIDHDFAFRDRAWPIERARAALTLDPAWAADDAVPIVREAARLAPGRGLVARIPLRWVGAGSGPVAPGVLSRAQRTGLGLALAAVLAAAAAAWRRHGRRRGLFDDPPDARHVDEAWLREHVLSRSPEVVGAAWDSSIGAPEVAAVLARMTAEGKLSTRVERVGWNIFGRDVLHLALRVDRNALEGYERDLVASIFVRGDTIDTDRLRAHYKEKGFDPASRIASALRKRAASLAPKGQSPGYALPLVAAIALLVAGGVLLGVSLARDVDGPAWMVSLHVVVAATIATIVLSFGLRPRVSGFAGWTVALLLLFVAWGAAVLWLAGGGAGPHPWFAMAHAVLWAGDVSLALAIARTPLGLEEIALRKRLAAARAHLARELARERPRLDDAWLPYLLAFGLGPDVDRWLRAFGVRGAGAGAPLGGAASGSGARWTGGGGAFSGGGASGTWAALGGVSRAIPSPSSGGSGGGGGGGGRSGGGGGGGW